MNGYGFLIVCYVLTIYLTLPWTRKAVEFLYRKLGHQGLSVLINFSLLAGIGAVLVFLKTINPEFSLRKSARPLAVFLAGFVVLFLYFAPEERVHLFEYGLLGFLCMKAQGGTGRGAVLTALFIVLLVGLGDEALQYLLPNRVGDLRDVVLNGISGIAGIMVQKTGAKGGGL